MSSELSPFKIHHYVSNYINPTRWCPPSYKLVYNPNNYRYNPLITPSYSTYEPTERVHELGHHLVVSILSSPSFPSSRFVIPRPSRGGPAWGVLPWPSSETAFALGFEEPILRGLRPPRQGRGLDQHVEGGHLLPDATWGPPVLYDSEEVLREDLGDMMGGTLEGHFGHFGHGMGPKYLAVDGETI